MDEYSEDSGESNFLESRSNSTNETPPLERMTAEQYLEDDRSYDHEDEDDNESEGRSSRSSDHDDDCSSEDGSASTSSSRSPSPSSAHTEDNIHFVRLNTDAAFSSSSQMPDVNTARISAVGVEGSYDNNPEGLLAVYSDPNHQRRLQIAVHKRVPSLSTPEIEIAFLEDDAIRLYFLNAQHKVVSYLVGPENTSIANGPNVNASIASLLAKEQAASGPVPFSLKVETANEASSGETERYRYYTTDADEKFLTFTMPSVVLDASGVKHSVVYRCTVSVDNICRCSQEEAAGPAGEGTRGSALEGSSSTAQLEQNLSTSRGVVDLQSTSCDSGRSTLQSNDDTSSGQSSSDTQASDKQKVNVITDQVCVVIESDDEDTNTVVSVESDEDDVRVISESINVQILKENVTRKGKGKASDANLKGVKNKNFRPTLSQTAAETPTSDVAANVVVPSDDSEDQTKLEPVLDRFKKELFKIAASFEMSSSSQQSSVITAVDPGHTSRAGPSSSSEIPRINVRNLQPLLSDQGETKNNMVQEGSAGASNHTVRTNWHLPEVKQEIYRNANSAASQTSTSGALEGTSDVEPATLDHDYFRRVKNALSQAARANYRPLVDKYKRNQESIRFNQSRYRTQLSMQAEEDSQAESEERSGPTTDGLNLLGRSRHPDDKTLAELLETSRTSPPPSSIFGPLPLVRPNVNIPHLRYIPRDAMSNSVRSDPGSSLSARHDRDKSDDENLLPPKKRICVSRSEEGSVGQQISQVNAQRTVITHSSDSNRSLEQSNASSRSNAQAENIAIAAAAASASAATAGTTASKSPDVGQSDPSPAERGNPTSNGNQGQTTSNAQLNQEIVEPQPGCSHWVDVPAVAKRNANSQAEKNTTGAASNPSTVSNSTCNTTVDTAREQDAAPTDPAAPTGSNETRRPEASGVSSSRIPEPIDWEAKFNDLFVKHNNLLRNIQSAVECPICFEVPRNAPIPCCKNGHVICKPCLTKGQSFMDSCPTCKSSLAPEMRGVSNVANTIVDIIPHSCKYRDHGCYVESVLTELRLHEKNCWFRIIRCPSYSCRELVSLKIISQHITSASHESMMQIHEVPKTFERYLGEVLKPTTFEPIRFQFDNKIFYLQTVASADSKFLYNFVQMEGSSTDCTKYKAQIMFLSNDCSAEKKETLRITPLDFHCKDNFEDINFISIITDIGLSEYIAYDEQSSRHYFNISVKMIKLLDEVRDRIEAKTKDVGIVKKVKQEQPRGSSEALADDDLIAHATSNTFNCVPASTRLKTLRYLLAKFGPNVVDRPFLEYEMQVGSVGRSAAHYMLKLKSRATSLKRGTNTWGDPDPPNAVYRPRSSLSPRSRRDGTSRSDRPESSFGRSRQRSGTRRWDDYRSLRYTPSPPADRRSSSEYNHAAASPAYNPTYSPQSPEYRPQSPMYYTGSPEYYPTSPAYNPNPQATLQTVSRNNSPTYAPISPLYTGI